MKRTHNCGELRLTDDKSEISLAGWIDRRRDHGGLIFIDLRDKYGKTQVVFEPDQKEIFDTADSLRNEFVISVEGVVRPRLEGKINDKLVTVRAEKPKPLYPRITAASKTAKNAYKSIPGLSPVHTSNSRNILKSNFWRIDMFQTCALHQ